MEKRLLLAIALSATVIFIFSYLLQDHTQPKQNITEVQRASALIDQKETQSGPQTKPEALLAREITIETQTSRIIITTQGAVAKHWYIKEKNGREIDLISQEKNNLLPFALVIETYPNINQEIFKVDMEKDNLSLKDQETKEVNFKYLSPQGITVVKKYIFTGAGYSHQMELSFVNQKASERLLPPVQLLWEPGIKEDKLSGGAKKAAGPTALINEKVERNLRPGTYTGRILWAALDSQYFLMALLPPTGENFSLIAKRDKNISGVGLGLPSQQLDKNQALKYRLKLYVGPKEYTRLKQLNLRLEEMAQFGSLGKFFFYILLFFYKITNNFGWAIVLLTLLIQLVMFPLTMKSFKSMKALQQLQPQMASLKTKYKDDPKRLNIEVMNLYKGHKVNPFGGCLPLVLQIPIFWALFTTLRNAVELRQAAFIFWIKDLSMPDTITRLGGFPINILPIIMGVTMLWQQKTSTVDPQQAKMMMFMPILFTVMFWNFPSGLVLYWLINNIITIMGQMIINRKI